MSVGAENISALWWGAKRSVISAGDEHSAFSKQCGRVVLANSVHRASGDPGARACMAKERYRVPVGQTYVVPASHIQKGLRQFRDMPEFRLPPDTAPAPEHLAESISNDSQVGELLVEFNDLALYEVSDVRAWAATAAPHADDVLNFAQRSIYLRISGCPMNLIERFVRRAVAETTGTGAIVRYVQILLGSTPHDF